MQFAGLSHLPATSSASPVTRVMGREWLLCGILAAVVALICIHWVGNNTIYSADVVDKRDAMFNAILVEQLPEGADSWRSVGAGDLNMRLATIWLTQSLHRISGVPVQDLLRLIDIVCVVASCVLLFALLRRWYEFLGALSGVLLLGMLLPLSMFLHFFHPWDKPALLLWVAMVMASVSGKPTLFLVLLVVAITNKTDAGIAAGLPLFLQFGVQPRRRVLINTLVAVSVGCLTLALLVYVVPGALEPHDLFKQFKSNITDLLYHNVAYPPLLVYGTLSVFAIFAWRNGDSVPRRLWLFALASLLPHAMLTNFQEVRAQLGSAICMIPLAVAGLESVGRRPVPALT
jgi:hypothetical protein